jgi:hypothetical protein
MIDDKLRALHDRWLPIVLGLPTGRALLGSDLSRIIYAAARIGAEIEREECADIAMAQALDRADDALDFSGPDTANPDRAACKQAIAIARAIRARHTTWTTGLLF